MLTIKDMIKLETVKLGYKLQHNLLPKNVHKLLWTDSKERSLQRTHKYATRDKKLPTLPKTRSSSYHRNFQFQCIKEYESIAVEIKNSVTIHSFVKKFKKTLFNYV